MDSCSIDDSGLALGSRSTGLGKVVQETRGRFHVLEWRVFRHTERLGNSPPRLKLVLSDSTAVSSFAYRCLAARSSNGNISGPL